MTRFLAVLGVACVALLLGCAESQPQQHTVLKPVADEVAHDHAGHDHGHHGHAHGHSHDPADTDKYADAITLPAEGEPVFDDKPLKPVWEKFVARDIGKLPPEDQKLALHQRFCPVMDRRLGTMGVPAKIDLDGQPVFVCCDCCQHDLRAHPDLIRTKLARYYATRDTLATAAQSEKPYFTEPELEAGWERIIARDIGKLPEKERPLAVFQRFCPVMKKRLGVMGAPIKVDLDGGPVFVCCEGCAGELRERQAELLPKLNAYKKSRAKVKPPQGDSE